MANPSIAAGSPVAGKPIPLRVAKRRRRNVRRNLGIMAAMSALMLLVTLAGRDQQDVRNCRTRLDLAVRNFRENVAAGLPPDFPPTEAHAVDPSHYTYRPDNLKADAPDGPLGVSCCAAPHRLFLDTDGRHVVIYDGQAFEIRWMSETEFQQRAESLGLADPAD